MSTPQDNRTDVVLAWRVHPIAERRGRAALGVTLVLAVAAAAGLTAGSILWAAFALVALVIGLNQFFLPSRFVIDEEGITARYPLRTRRMRWSQLRRFAHDREGGLLSTKRRPSRLDSFRSLHVHFGQAGDAAIEAIRTRMQRAGEEQGTPSAVRDVRRTAERRLA